MKYNAPYGATDQNAVFVNGNPATGTPGSIPPAASLEHPQREIVNVISYAGLTPSATDLEQLRKAIGVLISNAIAGISGGGGGGEGTLLFLPLAGGTMDNNANIAMSGTGIITINGHPVWYSENDGDGSGLDADKLGGVANSKFVRNDRDDEPAANSKVRLQRENAGSSQMRGIVAIVGRDTKTGGGRLTFLTGDASAVSAEIKLSDDRRTESFKMFSDAGLTYEDQARILDSGELWLRKLNGASIASGNVADAIIALQNSANTGPLDGTSIGSYYFNVSLSDAGPVEAPGLPGTWAQRGQVYDANTINGHCYAALYQRVA